MPEFNEVLDGPGVEVRQVVGHVARRPAPLPPPPHRLHGPRSGRTPATAAAGRADYPAAAELHYLDAAQRHAAGDPAGAAGLYAELLGGSNAEYFVSAHGQLRGPRGRVGLGDALRNLGWPGEAAAAYRAALADDAAIAPA